MGSSETGESGTDALIGCDASGHHKRIQPLGLCKRAFCPIDEAIDHGLLEGGRDVLRSVETRIASPEDSALQAREREMRLARSDQRARKRHRRQDSALGGVFDGGASWKAEAEHFGALVEGFAGGVIDRGGKSTVAADPFDKQELAMAARDEQEEIGKAEVRLRDHRRQCVALEMVERDKRLVSGERKPLRGDQPDHDPTDEAGPRRGGDRVHLVKGGSGFGKHIFYQPGQNFDVRARGDFGHHAPIWAMRALLPRKLVRQDAPVGGDQRCCGFVAARFYAENEAHAALPCHLRTR